MANYFSNTGRIIGRLTLLWKLRLKLPMKISLKVFIAIFSVTATILAISGALVLRFTTVQAKADYVSRYQNVAKQIGDTLVQVDKTTDIIMQNALYTLSEREKARSLPSNAELLRIKSKLGVDTLYITDRDGNYLRSDWFIRVRNDPKLRAYYGIKGPLSKSLFSYCKDYRKLITGESMLEKTPIVPSGNDGWRAEMFKLWRTKTKPRLNWMSPIFRSQLRKFQHPISYFSRRLNP